MRPAVSQAAATTKARRENSNARAGPTTHGRPNAHAIHNHENKIGTTAGDEPGAKGFSQGKLPNTNAVT